MPQYLVWRNGPRGLPEYPADHLRTVLVEPGEDPLEKAQRYMARDQTLVDFVGVISYLPSRRFRNCWRHDGERTVQVDVVLARQQVVAEAEAAADELATASEKRERRTRNPDRKAQHVAYRVALLDAVDAVAADLAAIKTADALAAYAPAWPEKPA